MNSTSIWQHKTASTFAISTFILKDWGHVHSGTFLCMHTFSVYKSHFSLTWSLRGKKITSPFYRQEAGEEKDLLMVSESVSELGLELRSSWFPVLCLVYYITLCLCLLLIFSASVFPWTPGTASTHSPTYWSSSSLQNNLWPTPLESPQSQSVPCNEIFFPFPLLRRLSYFHANFLPLTDTGS